MAANATENQRKPHKIRYHDDEWNLVVQRARECGMTPARYVRETSLGTIPKARRGHRELEAVHQLARIGNNLNQLAHMANLNEEIEEYDQLQAVLTEVLHVIKKFG